MDQTVDPAGQIIIKPLPPPPQMKPSPQQGSAITAAATAVAEKTAVQNQAIHVLGGKMTGGASIAAGAVEVKNIPSTPSAGGVNHAQVFANMSGLKAAALESGKYDALGNAPARIVGGSRKRRPHKKGNARSIHHNTRKRRRTSRKSRIVRHSRHRLRSRHRKTTSA